MKRIALLAFAGLALCGSSASAADICKAIALRDVAALDNPRSIIPKGDYDTAITGLHMNKVSGETAFCSHGGYCYPTHVTVRSKTVEALRLTNCSVDRSMSDDDGEEITYEMSVSRSAVPAAQWRKDYLDSRFLQMGLCSACADNAAQYYVTQPASPCAKLAKRALEGDPTALTQLQRRPAFCTYHYR